MYVSSFILFSFPKIPRLKKQIFWRWLSCTYEDFKSKLRRRRRKDHKNLLSIIFRLVSASVWGRLHISYCHVIQSIEVPGCSYWTTSRVALLCLCIRHRLHRGTRQVFLRLPRLATVKLVQTFRKRPIGISPWMFVLLSFKQVGMEVRFRWWHLPLRQWTLRNFPTPEFIRTVRFTTNQSERSIQDYHRFLQCGDLGWSDSIWKTKTNRTCIRWTNGSKTENDTLNWDFNKNL